MKSLEIQDLSFKYADSGFRLLIQDLICEKNESLGLIGPTASGKTTLLKIIVGFLKFQGRISIFGKKMGKSLNTEQKQKIYYLQQNPENQIIFNTPYEEIAFNLDQKGVSKSKLKDLIKQCAVGMEIEHILHHNIGRLSYGQKKKICLAPILGKEFDLLLLDDPVAGLAAGDHSKLAENLNEQKKSKIIASTDLDFILKTCRRVIILNNGKVVSSGKVNEIMSNQQLMEENGLVVPLNITLYKSIYI